MALRRILTQEDELLHKVCKPVEAFDEKLGQLLDDMHETLDKAQGVGLAGPQIGVCRRIFIMHLEDDDIIEAINPQVLKNGRVKDKHAAQNDPAVQAAVRSVSEALGSTGRILVRESGTEPVIRVMVEAPTKLQCQQMVDTIVDVICAQGHSRV